MRPSPSASCRPAACAPTLRRRPTLAPRQAGSDAHNLDVLPTMWATALAFFQQAVASPAAVIDGTLELIVDGVRKEKLTAQARRASLDMARTRQLAAGYLLVGRVLSAAFTAMAAATRNHAALSSSPAASVQPRASPPSTASA
eukprot:5488333-Pleurochrysis_carterae.AAC.2